MWLSVHTHTYIYTHTHRDMFPIDWMVQRTRRQKKTVDSASKMRCNGVRVYMPGRDMFRTKRRGEEKERGRGRKKKYATSITSSFEPTADISNNHQ